MGVRIERGDPAASRAGASIVIPEHPSQLRAVDVELDAVRRSYVKHALEALPAGRTLEDADVSFLAAETRTRRTPCGR
jgi:hypothetical protein